MCSSDLSEGGKESTGLVTCFTMTRPESLPEGHPMQIRLLSETDLVKIIANTWFADCEHKEEPQSDIKTSLDALAGRAQKVTDSPIDLDALEDLLLPGYGAQGATGRSLAGCFDSQGRKIGRAHV